MPRPHLGEKRRIQLQRLIKVTLFCLVLSSPFLPSEFLFGDTPLTITPGDYNGDGASDILWRDTSGNVAIGLMDGLSLTKGSTIANIWTGWTIVGSGDFTIWLMDGLTVTSFSTIANIQTGWTIVGTGDFNGDGKADILWRDTAGNVAIWLMDGATVASYDYVANVPGSWAIAG